MKTVRVLLVDPDQATRQLVRNTLEERSYELVLAAHAKEGLNVATRTRPDLIILNIALSMTEGISMLRALRTNPPTALIPVLFLAHRGSVEDHLRGFKLGADDFMPKPIDPMELGLRVVLALKVRERTQSTLRSKASAKGNDLSWSGLLATFRGSLEEIGLPSLLSLMETERKTGVLVLTLDPSNEKARISMREGQVVRARMDHNDSPKNAALIYRLFQSTKGKFEFRPKPVVDADEIQMPVNRLLLEGARLTDDELRSKS